MSEIDDAAIDPAIEAEHSIEFNTGNMIDEVTVDIDFAIIKHFSEHLYSSPNKAIEELVSNGFDAMATHCFVYIPGIHVTNRVIVWDDGLSMDAQGLQDMWQIARSPKEAFGEDRINELDGVRRAMIGKFGIGKLASYAVGYRISHICKTTDGRFLTVSVNYRDFTDEKTNERKSVTGNRSERKTPIRELTKEAAHELIDELLPDGAARDYMFPRNHWTLAVIDDLKEVALYPGRLNWVLGNGMPLRPDFRVFVEDQEVTTRLESKASALWEMNEERIQKSLKTAWAEAEKQGSVSGQLIYPNTGGPAPSNHGENQKIDTPEVEFPILGKVSATVRIFDESLALKGKQDGRSYGFFLVVRGRLVNPDDDKLLLSDPSFGTFYRSQYVINADVFDRELLADRESIRRDTAMTRELAVLQKALYRAARADIESRDEEKNVRERAESRLPTRSRELFRDPMAALLAKTEGEPVAVDLNEPSIDRVDLGEDRPLAEFNHSNGHFEVNRTHPFYKAIETQAGAGKKAAATMRAFDLFAVSERLTEGFLYGRGIADDQVEDLLSWRDKLFRSLAVTYGKNPDDVILEMRSSSIPGGARFENAITELFNEFGFTATRHGEPGAKDILVVAPLGPNHRTFIIEAKGSDKPVVNVTAALASAAAHRDAAEGAVHALVVAREFAGFKNKDEPAILLECEAVHGVSVVTVETLVLLYNALLKYSYPLDSVMDALFEIETPTEKMKRIEALDKPLYDFNFREVLEDIWVRQSGESAEDQVPIRAVWQGNKNWRSNMSMNEFSDKLAALDHFSGGLMILDSSEKTVYLKHSPDKVSAHVQRCIELTPSPLGDLSAE